MNSKKFVILLSFLLFFNIKSADITKKTIESRFNDFINKIESLYNKTINTVKYQLELAKLKNLLKVRELNHSELKEYAAIKIAEFESNLNNKANIEPKELLEFALLYFIQEKFIQAAILLNEIIHNPKTDEEIEHEAYFMLGRIYEIQSSKLETSDEQKEFEMMSSEFYNKISIDEPITKTGIELTLDILDDQSLLIESTQIAQIISLITEITKQLEVCKLKNLFNLQYLKSIKNILIKAVNFLDIDYQNQLYSEEIFKNKKNYNQEKLFKLLIEQLSEINDKLCKKIIEKEQADKASFIMPEVNESERASVLIQMDEHWKAQKATRIAEIRQKLMAELPEFNLDN